MLQDTQSPFDVHNLCTSSADSLALRREALVGPIKKTPKKSLS